MNKEKIMERANEIYAVRKCKRIDLLYTAPEAMPKICSDQVIAVVEAMCELGAAEQDISTPVEATQEILQEMYKPSRLDMFAMAAMQGFCANSDVDNMSTPKDIMAEIVVDEARAVIEELDKW